MIFLICNLTKISAQCKTSSSCLTSKTAPDFSGPAMSERPSQCLKIKFHFVKDNSNNEAFPSDEDYLRILTELNSAYSNSKLKFEMADCINRQTFNGEFNYTNVLFSPNKTLEFDWDPNALNVYSESQTNGAHDGIAFPYRNFCITKAGGTQMIHEIGHLLGLIHTHGPVAHEKLDQSCWECKLASNNLYEGDGIPDTGADPHGMDLNNDNCADGRFDTNGDCIQSALKISKMTKDRCLDEITEWNIPITNYMSYYNNCGSEFTEYQNRAMHNFANNKIPEIKLSPCPAILIDCTSPPIYINGNVIWDAQYYQLCKDQQVIINPNSTLTIKNTRVSKKASNSSCPGLSNTGNWDGIYVLNNAKLYINNSSIIEYSNNGIQSLSSGLVTINGNSIMRNNKTAIASDLGFVSINNSTIIVPKYCHPVQVSLTSSGFKMDNSTIENGEGENITAIKSFNAAVDINTQSKIKNFYVGVDKEEGNSSSGNSLSIDQSRFENCITAIRNMSNVVKVTANFIDGAVLSSGVCNGLWYANNFRKGAVIDDPQSTQDIRENFFYSKELVLNRDNKVTDALCNQWSNTTLAVDGSCTDIKSEWGSYNISSGNRHLNPYCIMQVHASNDITNWHKNELTNTVFNNLFNFRGDNASQIKTCQYNIYPPTVIGNNPNGLAWIPPYTAGDGLGGIVVWQQLNDQNQALQTQVANSTGDGQLSLKSQIENNRVKMDQIVSYNYFSNLALENENSAWTSKMNSKINIIDNFVNLFNNSSYSTLLTAISSQYIITPDPDLNNLYNAVNQIINYLNSGKDIYNLPYADRQNLVNLSKISYGDYTSIIRAFLNVTYNIRIDPPVFNTLESRENIQLSKSSDISEMVVIPNPTHDKFLIQNMENKNEPIQIQLFSTDGKLLLNKNGFSDQYFELDQNLTHGIYLLKIRSLDSNKESFRRIIIE